MMLRSIDTDVRTVEDARRLIHYYRVWEVDLLLEKASRLIFKSCGQQQPKRPKGRRRPIRYK